MRELDLTVHDATMILGVSPSTVRRWCNLGHLPHYRTPGGQRRFKRSELTTFVETLKAPTTPTEGRPA